MKTRAAIMEEDNKALRIELIDMDEPKENEILVRLVSTGVCGTDTHFWKQSTPMKLPAVLGHEGGGIVEKIGSNVRNVNVGEHVLIYNSYCGECEKCLAGKSTLCAKSMDIVGRNIDGTYRFHWNGQDVGNMFSMGTFKEHVIVDKTAICKVDKSLDLKALSPFACGPKSGAAAVLNTAKVAAGDEIAVMGAGTVGLSAVMAAKIAGCKTIICCDVFENRLQMAKELGATHVLNGKEVDLLQEIRSITGGGADFVIECTGVPDIFDIGLKSLKPAGTIVMVGDGYPKKIQLDYREMTSYGRNVLGHRGAGGGGQAWAPFVSKIIGFYQAGKFPVDKLVKYYKFEDINKAMEDSINGSVIKPIVLFD